MEQLGELPKHETITVVTLLATDLNDCRLLCFSFRSYIPFSCPETFTGYKYLHLGIVPPQISSSHDIFDVCTYSYCSKLQFKCLFVYFRLVRKEG